MWRDPAGIFLTLKFAAEPDDLAVDGYLSGVNFIGFVFGVVADDPDLFRHPDPLDPLDHDLIAHG